MKRVVKIAYRYLTAAEFFHTNKPRGTEQGGGGQTYIDFPIQAITADQWGEFFENVKGLETGVRRNGPLWRFPVHGVGLVPQDQQVTLGQRRAQSFTVSAQHIEANRVAAWHPDHGFPRPADPDDRNQLPEGLCVYLARTDDDEVWAGWFENADAAAPPCQDEVAEAVLNEMLDPERHEGDAGMIDTENTPLLMDEADAKSPFATSADGAAAVAVIAAVAQKEHARGAEEEIADRLFGEDVGYAKNAPAEVVQRVQQVRRRNQRAATDLKKLYGYECQVSHQPGFQKTDGTPYAEVHHLVALGQKGDDDPRNMLVVDPRIHRMLHYAKVTGVSLKKIKIAADGTASLQITIGGTPYTVTWRKEHAARILKHEQKQQA